MDVDMRIIERPTLAQAARRHSGVVILCVVVGAVAMVALGLSREPTYSAETSLIIGKVDPRIGGVSGFLTTTQAFAKGYTRVIESEEVVREVSHRVGLTRGQILERTSASITKDAPLLRIRATGSSRQAAVALASAIGQGVSQEINRINRPRPGADDALSLFERGSARYQRLAAEGKRLQRVLNLQAAPSPTLQRTLGGVRAEAEATRLRVEEFKQAYRAADADPSRNLVRVLAAPRAANSDRARVLEFLAYVGGVGGLVVGLGVAWRRSPRELYGSRDSPVGGRA